MAELPEGGVGLVKRISEFSAISGNSNNPENAADFDAIIEDLDRELANSNPTSNTLVAEVFRDIKGKEADKVNPKLVHDFVEMLGESKIVGFEKVFDSMQAELGNVGFLVGWVEVSEKKKNVKQGIVNMHQRGLTEKVRLMELISLKSIKKVRGLGSLLSPIMSRCCWINWRN